MKIGYSICLILDPMLAANFALVLLKAFKAKDLLPASFEIGEESHQVIACLPASLSISLPASLLPCMSNNNNLPMVVCRWILVHLHFRIWLLRISTPVSRKIYWSPSLNWKQRWTHGACTTWPTCWNCEGFRKGSFWDGFNSRLWRGRKDSPCSSISR